MFQTNLQPGRNFRMLSQQLIRVLNGLHQDLIDFGPRQAVVELEVGVAKPVQLVDIHAASTADRRIELGFGASGGRELVDVGGHVEKEQAGVRRKHFN